MAVSLPSKKSTVLSPFFSRHPFRALQEEMDDLLSRFSRDWDEDWLAGTISPSLDLSEADDSLQIRMDMPGIKPDDINIEVTGNTVRITGERKEEKEEKGKTFHRIERRTGTFARSLTLPCKVREDKVDAACDDGVLTITLPKTEEAKTHKVKVKANGK